MTASASVPLITIQNAAFGYAERPVIQNVSLTVGLVGPNGAGKSTLFKGLLGLIRPLGGIVVRTALLERRIGYVPQRDTLDASYPLTAGHVVAMGWLGPQPWYRRLSSAGSSKIHDCLKKVGLYEKRGEPFATLSGGQRQRVLIARAMAIDPLLLVLDEPTAGVDPEAEDIIMRLLSDLHQHSKISILMVSHHREALREHAERVITVENGAVQE